MWCSTKKDNGTLRLMKRNTTSFLYLKKRRNLNMFSKSSPHQHQPLMKTIFHLLRVKRLCHAQEPSKIFMIELRDWIISNYFVSFHIFNKWALKKLCKIKDGEMWWMKKLDPSKRTTHGNSSPFRKGTSLLVSSGCTKQKKIIKKNKLIKKKRLNNETKLIKKTD